jgi:hypothetical protein
MRANDIIVDDVPKHLGHNAAHSIYVPWHNICIPLQIKGIISCFTVPTPTDDEIETCQ